MRSIVSVVLIATALGAVQLHTHGQAAPPKPEFARAADALERVTWRTRTLVSDDRLTNWNFTIPIAGFKGLTFLDGVVRADAAVVDLVEGASTQTVSAQVQKHLDANLTAAEIADLRTRMGTVKMAAYRVETVPADSAARRKLFEFAKAMEVDTIVVPAAVNLAGVDTLAEEFGINVAIWSDAAGLSSVRTALEGRTTRVGIATLARDALSAGDRLLYIGLSGATPALFHELNRRNIRPLILALDTSGLQNAASDLYRAIDTFEAIVQPAYGAHFNMFSRAVPIRRDLYKPARGETLSDAEIAKRSADALQKIRAAIPAQPYATPKKPRKLLVIESLQGMSHDTIPHANVMLDEIGKITGAWTTEFNNDLNNLKYPKIKEYDGIFLNSIVGEFAADLEVRDGLARFVREGGGLGGVHGTPWASRNWDEFAEMIGSQSAPHRIEQGVMKVYDAASPLMTPFNGKDLNFREEYYRFEHEGRGRVRWDKVRVLMTVALDDPKIEPRPWTGYKRPDNVYPVSWIRTYGRGRVFYSSLGHMPETFWTPELVGHFFAGVQYLLGDLDADATPNPRTGAGTAPQAPGAPGAPGAPAAPSAPGPGAPAAPNAPGPSAPSAPSAPGAPAPVPSISDRPTGSSLGMIRVGASDNNMWFGWRVAMPATAIKGLNLSETLVKADGYPISVPSVVASSTQIVSREVPKPLDYRLQPGERGAINYRLRELNEQIAVYSIADIGADAATRRKVFELAKSINSPLIVTSAAPSSLPELEALAEEFAINVAFEGRGDPRTALRALEGRGKRIGVGVDLRVWQQQGIKPVDGLAIVKDRLLFVRTAALGDGVTAVSDFFLAAYRAGVKPLSISIEPTGVSEADYAKDVIGFERVMWPAMAERVRTMLASPAGKIRGPDRLTPDDRKAIEAAAPRQAVRSPKKPRKLLVTDIQMYSGHSTIPHGNYLIELIAKNTGAFEPTFSNDLTLLKYPAIKQFDAVYLNNVCGMVYNDPEVREGILRFVREGGGIGGHHAVTFANNHWPEFADMMGGWAGAHHIETQMLKVDDASSPLTKSLGGASFEHTDEFYIFPTYSPYSREKQHILLSIDVEKSDRATANRFCSQCTRPDQDYGLAWIKTYGKGRAYFTPLGHTNIFYTDPRWTNHLLAAIQYILGDVDADASPSARKGTQN